MTPVVPLESPANSLARVVVLFLFIRNAWDSGNAVMLQLKCPATIKSN